MKRAVIIAVFFLLPAMAFSQGLPSSSQSKQQPAPPAPPPAPRTIDPKKPLAQPEIIESKQAPPARLKLEDKIKELQDLLKDIQNTSADIRSRLARLRRQGYFYWEESVAGPPHPDDFGEPSVILPSNRLYITGILRKTDKIIEQLKKDLKQAAEKLSQAKPGSKVNPKFVDYLTSKLEEIKSELARLKIYERQGQRYLTDAQKKELEKIKTAINKLKAELEKLKNNSAAR